MKIAKVKWQRLDERTGEVFGTCGCCGETVRRDAKGIDEECRECGCELDWSVSGNEPEVEKVWRDWRVFDDED